MRKLFAGEDGTPKSITHAYTQRDTHTRIARVMREATRQIGVLLLPIAVHHQHSKHQIKLKLTQKINLSIVVHVAQVRL